MKLQIFCKYNLKTLNGPFILSLPLIGTLMDNKFISKNVILTSFELLYFAEIPCHNRKLATG